MFAAGFPSLLLLCLNTMPGRMPSMLVWSRIDGQALGRGRSHCGLSLPSKAEVAPRQGAPPCGNTHERRAPACQAALLTLQPVQRAENERVYLR